MATENLRREIEYHFKDLKFKKKEHRYFVGLTPYPSVSSNIEKHTTFVDFTQKAKNRARNTGVSLKQVQEEWAQAGEIACRTGTITHDFAETYTGIEEPQTQLEWAVKRFLDELPLHYVVVCKELRMFSRIYKYAGTADLVLLDLRDNSLVIADYKTNNDLFKFYNTYLKPPFQKLEQTPFNKYQLQLSYYQIMLEEVGYKVSKRMIVWLKSDGNYTSLYTYDFTKELRECL